MEWVPVKSKVLAAITYSRRWRQLYLKFNSGEVYCYRNVPVERYTELLAAESKGAYIRSHILNQHPHQRIHSAVSSAT